MERKTRCQSVFPQPAKFLATPVLDFEFRLSVQSTNLAGGVTLQTGCDKGLLRALEQNLQAGVGNFERITRIVLRRGHRGDVRKMGFDDLNIDPRVNAHFLNRGSTLQQSCKDRGDG